MLPQLIRASLDGAFVVTVVWAIGRLVPSLSARTGTTLWWCAAAKFVISLLWISPITVAVLPAAADSHRSSQPHVQTIATPGTGATVGDSREAADAALSGVQDWSWADALTLAWSVGFALSLGVGAQRWRTMSTIRRHAAPATASMQSLVRNLSSQLQLSRVPDVRLSNDVETPLVAGLISPTVLLPSQRFAALPEPQQRMVLCHELTHLKRADLWLGCAPALAERLFFFHPLVHFAAREYAVWREAACDAAVLEAMNVAPREYGQLLLDLGVSRRPTLAVAGASWSFIHLKRRIAMLRDQSPRSFHARFAAGVIVCAAFAALPPVRLAARLASPLVNSIDQEEVNSAGDQAGARDQTNEPRVTYVLLVDDDHTMMSGSSGDAARARRFKRAGEPVLWFRTGGHEYVVRDRQVLQE